ncbi:MAG: response regulator [Calditrichaceae bacterium]|nr:ATP-binding protein [Calditrichia bacterium]NUQ42274.1 response regulator [Calditrichaceae bacterium]
MKETGSFKILYMEDDPGLGRLFQKRLSRLGHRVTLAADGGEGLARYHEYSFDVLVIDYQMPVLDGLQVLRKLGENGSLPPVIMLTGAGTEEIAVEAMKIGATDYIVKDVDNKYFEVLPLVIKDAVQRYRFEEEKRRMQKELERSNKELQQFAYVVSHDLKEPLQTIRGFAKFLEENYHQQLDDQANEFIGYIIDGTKRMERLVNGLLDYSRVRFKKTEPEPVDCNVLVEQVKQDLKGIIDSRKARVTHDPLPTVLGDERLLLRLFLNLIDNALKYCKDRPPEVHVRAEAKKDFWQFSIKDNGIGIDPRHVERIFVIFQRLHPRKEFNGDGLGLAICKKIVEIHKGDIWVESEPGQGSTFYFTIPGGE